MIWLTATEDLPRNLAPDSTGHGSVRVSVVCSQSKVSRSSRETEPICPVDGEWWARSKLCHVLETVLQLHGIHLNGIHCQLGVGSVVPECPGMPESVHDRVLSTTYS